MLKTHGAVCRQFKGVNVCFVGSVELLVVQRREMWGVSGAQFVDDSEGGQVLPVFGDAFHPPVVSHSAVSVFAREVPNLEVVDFLECRGWVGGLCGDNVATCSNNCRDVLSTVFSVNL